MDGGMVFTDANCPDAGAAPDASADVPVDVPTDVAADVAADVLVDAPVDAPLDALVDAPVDSLPDVPGDAPCLTRAPFTLAPCDSVTDCFSYCDMAEADGFFAYCWPVEGPSTSIDFEETICHWHLAEQPDESQGCADLRETAISCATPADCPPIGCAPPFNRPDSIIVECLSLECAYRRPF